MGYEALSAGSDTSGASEAPFGLNLLLKKVYGKERGHMQEGAFVEIEFVGKIKDTGEIFDLTDEKLAKEKDIFDKDHKYGPALVVVGSKSVVPAVEDKIKELGIGEEAEFEVKPDKGFGKRDPKMIQIVSINKFYQEKINPIPGAFVNIDGKNCRIQSVSGGRVRVDFNHPLAGKDLLYKLKVSREITDTKEKVDSLLKQLDLEAETKLESDNLKIKLKKSNIMIEKIVEDSIKKWVKEIKSVEFKRDDAEKRAEADKVSAQQNLEGKSEISKTPEEPKSDKKSEELKKGE